MTEAGFTELLLILVVALIVVGPERLPGLARKAGYWVGRLRQYVAGVRSEIEEQLQADELRQMMAKQEQEMAELRQMLEKSRGEVEGGLEEVNEYLVRASDDAAKPAAEKSAGTTDEDDGGPGTAPAEALPQGFQPAPPPEPEPAGDERKPKA